MGEYEKVFREPIDCFLVRSRIVSAHLILDGKHFPGCAVSMAAKAVKYESGKSVPTPPGWLNSPALAGFVLSAVQPFRDNRYRSHSVLRKIQWQACIVQRLGLHIPESCVQ
jgi:hypothetical protein